MSDGNDREYWMEVHQHISSIMDFYLESGEIPMGALEEYDQLGVKPSHEHKSISDHKSAIFALGEVLAEHTDQSGAPGGTTEVMREMKEALRDND